MTKYSLWISLAIVVAALVLLSVRRDTAGKTGLGKVFGLRRVRLLAGTDNRASTSKAVLLGWTVIVVWLVISCVFESEGVQETFNALTAGLGTSYFAVLGGPVLAAVLAKAVTQSKTSDATPSLQKTEAEEPSLGDLVSTDNGGLAVGDTQYVLLNLCAAAYVVYAFATNPDAGIPDFPEQLALLAGGSAATYVGTKSWTANAPQITAMTPSKIKANTDVKVSIRGVNLVSPGRSIKLAGPRRDEGKPLITEPGTATEVMIDGYKVPEIFVNARSEEVFVTGLPPEIPISSAGAYDVTVVTAAGLRTTAPEQLTIVV